MTYRRERRLKHTNAALVVGICLMCVACASQRGKSDAERAEQFARLAAVEAQLQASLGQPFPSMQLSDSAGASVRMADIVGDGVALFYAGGPCPGSAEWADDLRNDNWRFEGRKVISLVKTRNFPTFNSHLEGSTVLLTQWPLPDYLSKNTFYPIMYLVGRDGRLEGYKWQHKPIVRMSAADERPQ